MIIETLNIYEYDIETLKTGVSAERLEKANRYKFEEDILRSLSVEFLLNEMIKKNYPDYPIPVKLKYDDREKPHLYDKEGIESLYISLSHSGDLVACMLDTVPCGVDIEIHKEKIYTKIAKRICTEIEYQNIKSVRDFYHYWTLKESVLKATGMGLSLDMKSFEITQENDMYTTIACGNKYTGQVISRLNRYPDGYTLSYMRKTDE